MDPYDSDSSGLEDAGDYTETGVLLGYASTEQTDDTISHLGGWPTWLDKNTPPPGDLAKCKVCNNPMLLLLQLNGDLPERFSNDERWLYIFGCPRKACSRKQGSIRALRGIRKMKGQSEIQKKEDSTSNGVSTGATPAPKQDLGSALFGAPSQGGGLSSNSNPFSTSSSPAAQNNNPFAPLPPVSTLAAKPPQNPALNFPETFAAKARISTPETLSEPVTAGPVLPWPDKSVFPAPYTEYYLDADYETLSRPSTPTIPTNTTVENVEEESGGTADVKDAFESSMDKDFLRFSTRLAHNPEQVLRYEFSGTPLLYSGTDAVAKAFPSHQTQGRGVQVAPNAGTNNRIPRCPSCGRERVFELQLVPHAITVLEDGREGIGLGKNDAGMEWGTIILGVCAANCGTVKEGDLVWKEEWVGVQWEETK
ncbi:PDCD2_C domain protein, putative [Talaromyces stipitatus ATCC 10500]|uniref:PDCD2_C domain protein, putative n=1 Tax=Talaromyces stipitatus (strain ATCC 10500 / CBS 375.48 / QM 6759 / NRRL 1006) TaxID=441959 RepID=B8M702_TALSN|nr:PDCD2_C domain protein, putative [Talaromyces stipitatus ATCC 10500]EED20222.1 PDCD2_C domain protein, putative [Talaromyces stipitatus ATCC 10500]